MNMPMKNMYCKKHNTHYSLGLTACAGCYITQTQKVAEGTAGNKICPKHDVNFGDQPECLLCLLSKPSSPMQKEAPQEGLKNDDGKPPISMIPRPALEQEAKVFAFGAGKYGRDNYKLGMDWTRLIDASLRHIVAFNSGEDLDPESNLHHLAHARSNLGMLLEYITHDLGNDDRSKAKR